MYTTTVTPGDFHAKPAVCRYVTETEVQLRAPLTGVSIASVNLAHQFSSVWKDYGGLRPDSGSVVQICQTQAHEGARIRAGVVVEKRRFPLVGEHEIQPTIAIHV
jgi:hypothetical protein